MRHLASSNIMLVSAFIHCKGEGHYAIILSAVMQSAVMLSAIMLCAIILSAVMQCRYAECRNAECYAECHLC
jgi:hypothetical protein